ncbi:MAG: divalent-cation tolerance protein CutA [Verrucomicrobiae bacterium]|nr:divalent-cation tolerance protein CutA [Verrucomicrobiae bacterium]
MVFVTAPDIDTGRRIARSVVEAGLAACVNMLPGVESHYRWEGKLECGQEVLLLMKTTLERLTDLESKVLAEHPYDTPEFVVTAIEGGNDRYLAWLRG